MVHGVLVNDFEHVVRSVAHALLGVSVGDAEGEHDGCVGVAQIVETVVGETQPFAQAGKCLVHSLTG